VSVGEDTRQLVGSRVARKEDRRFLTGQGRYVDDVTVPGVLHLAFVRSSEAHARIVSVSTEAALSVPGVHAVYAAEDVAGLIGPVRALCSAPGYIETDMPVLATGKVRMVGEPVVAVVADSRYLAEDGAEEVVVEYEPLPCIVSTDDPEPGGPAVAVHEDVPGGRFMHYEVESGDVDEAFRSADVVVEVEARNQRYCAVPLEGRAVLAVFDPGRGELTVWLTSQVPHITRTGLARFLGLPETRVRVIAPDIGGSFGPKAGLYPEELVASAISRELGRPVRWTSDRLEDLQSSCHGREQTHRLQAAAASDGRILGIRADIRTDSGAYAQWPWGAGTDAAQADQGMTGPYDIANYARSVSAVITNKVPMGPYRGVGKVMACFSMERVVERVADKLGLDPLDVRRANLVREFPHWTPGGYKLESGDYHHALDLLEEAIDYRAVRAENERLRAEGLHRGVGVSCGVEQTAQGGKFLGDKQIEIAAGYDTASVRVEPDGRVSVAVGLHSHGQSHETTLAQIAADELGIPMDEIDIVFGDTATAPYGMGTWGSRSLVYCGGATILAARDVHRKIVELAADMLEARPSDLVVEDGVVSPVGVPSRGIGIREVARRAHHEPHLLPEGVEPGLESTRRYQAPSPGSFTLGMHAAVVEVDVETGLVDLLRYVVVEDCGRLVNPTVVEGQVHGGVAQGIGGALLEHMVYGDDGQIETGSLMDYLLPTFMDVPRIEVIHVESPSPDTVGGFKGMAEGGAIMSPGAIVSAVNDALAPFGVVADHTPLTPDWIATSVRRALERRRA
jgi:aerobic carbon-monoxide dehydrogenase large subunit